MNEIFDMNLEQLKKVFQKKTVSQNCKRLRDILTETGKYWLANTKGIGLSQIKYLLICEAPPWSEDSDSLNYFYKPVDSTLHTRIWNAIYPNKPKPNDPKEVFKCLKERRFLLIDSLPYSLKYKSCHRNKAAYDELVKNSIDWWIKKISENFDVDENLKIAFVFRKNACSIIRSLYNSEIVLKKRRFKVSEDNISADESNMPNPDILSNIFEIFSV